jgi:adenosylmethionine-8-amino-7-oxononanoate aminotransferase
MRRAQFAPLLIETSHVAPCYEYRDRAPQETPDAYSQRLVRELEAAIERLGPTNVIAFVAETVVGATAGAVPPTPGYFRRIRELCDRHGILLILDEVMCGMGRTGTLHACEQESIVPDLMTIAKGLGGGYGVIGATLVAGRIVDALARGSGAFQHGHTYIGHALACAAALAVQDTIRDEGLLANVRARGDELAQALSARFADHPHVGDIRGRGLFRALELVADRATKAPFDPALRLHARVKAQGMQRGLMTYPGGGTIDGRYGDHVLLAPPYIVTTDDIDEIVRRLGDAVDAAIAEVGVGAVTA